MSAETAAMALGVRSGDRASIARAVSLIERGDLRCVKLLDAIADERGCAYRIGITGPPGAGKSTLTMQMIRRLRALDARVAVIAVDPSSPWSQGALLGDRVRMNEVAADEGVFIRSMATRGALGGLSAAVADAADVFDAAGFEYLLVESVGVGQNELDIVAATDTVLVVLTPESGDDVQMTKAGLLEIADVYVINKDDRPGGDLIHAALSEMLQTQRSLQMRDSWERPIVRSVAQRGDGAERIVEAIEAHRAYQLKHGLLEKRRGDRLRARIVQLASKLIESEFWCAERLCQLDAALVAARQAQASAHAVARSLVAGFLKSRIDEPT